MDSATLHRIAPKGSLPQVESLGDNWQWRGLGVPVFREPPESAESGFPFGFPSKTNTETTLPSKQALPCPVQLIIWNLVASLQLTNSEAVQRPKISTRAGMSPNVGTKKNDSWQTSPCSRLQKEAECGETAKRTFQDCLPSAELIEKCLLTSICRYAPWAK